MVSTNSSDSEEYLSAEEEEKTQSIETKSASGEITSAMSDMSVNERGKTDPNHQNSDLEHSIGSRDPEAESNANRYGNESGTPPETGTNEFVSDLDNRYVSEDVEIKEGGKIELTEEQIKEMKEQAGKLKAQGNDSFKNEDNERAIELYTEALKLYPADECGQEISVCHANRAACYMKLEKYENVVEDCTKALELKPDYLKALIRRAQSYEKLDKLEEALEDYKKVIDLDPSQTLARQAVMRLPDQIKEQHEKMKAEMIGKLKELGDAVLKPFGLSTSNFQLQQDPNTGGYSINFKN